VEKRILIVEDEKPIAKLLSYHLEREGYQTVACYDGDEALRVLRGQAFDLVVLDLMLPKISGWDILRTARKEGKTFPVILLSARGEEADKVAGLELGADDYVTKPFSPRELVARVGAHLRRSNASLGQDAAEKNLVYGPIVLDENTREVSVAGVSLEFTAKEFDLLAHMMKQPGRVFTREHLLSKIWGYDFEGDTRTVDVHISRIRQKIDSAMGIAGEGSIIETVRGVGYKLILRDSDKSPDAGKPA